MSGIVLFSIRFSSSSSPLILYSVMYCFVFRFFSLLGGWVGVGVSGGEGGGELPFPHPSKLYHNNL